MKFSAKKTTIATPQNISGSIYDNLTIHNRTFIGTYKSLSVGFTPLAFKMGSY
jgi:hypothetical protein